MTVLQLTGEVDNRDALIEGLQEENRQLTADLLAARAQLAQVQKQNARAIAKLRAMLTPLYRSLQELFGEMAAAGGEAEIEPAPSAKWDAVKQRLQPRLREAIDILLLQGTLKRTQLAAAMKMDYSNCAKNVVAVLLRQGLLIETGQGLALKELS